MTDYRRRKKSKLRAGLFIAGLLCLSIGYIGQYLTASTQTSSNVGGRELPIYCVQTDKKQVALSFDAAWGNEDTAKILEILKKHDVHLTFFMTGGWEESYPDDVKAVNGAGREVGDGGGIDKKVSQ